MMIQATEKRRGQRLFDNHLPMELPNNDNQRERETASTDPSGSQINPSTDLMDSETPQIADRISDSDSPHEENISETDFVIRSISRHSELEKAGFAQFSDNFSGSMRASGAADVDELEGVFWEKSEESGFDKFGENMMRSKHFSYSESWDSDSNTSHDNVSKSAPIVSEKYVKAFTSEQQPIPPSRVRRFAGIMTVAVSVAVVTMAWSTLEGVLPSVITGVAGFVMLLALGMLWAFSYQL